MLLSLKHQRSKSMSAQFEGKTQSTLHEACVHPNRSLSDDPKQKLLLLIHPNKTFLTWLCWKYWPSYCINSYSLILLLCLGFFSLFHLWLCYSAISDMAYRVFSVLRAHTLIGAFTRSFFLRNKPVLFPRGQQASVLTWQDENVFIF